jgi:amino acid permease
MSAIDPSNKGSDSGEATDKIDFVESNAAPPHQDLQRQLKNRHVAMIRYIAAFLSVLCEWMH